MKDSCVIPYKLQLQLATHYNEKLLLWIKAKGCFEGELFTSYTIGCGLSGVCIFTEWSKQVGDLSYVTKILFMWG